MSGSSARWLHWPTPRSAVPPSGSRRSRCSSRHSHRRRRRRKKGSSRALWPRVRAPSIHAPPLPTAASPPAALNVATGEEAYRQRPAALNPAANAEPEAATAKAAPSANGAQAKGKKQKNMCDRSVATGRCCSCCRYLPDARELRRLQTQDALAERRQTARAKKPSAAAQAAEPAEPQKPAQTPPEPLAQPVESDSAPHRKRRAPAEPETQTVESTPAKAARIDDEAPAPATSATSHAPSAEAHSRHPPKVDGWRAGAARLGSGVYLFTQRAAPPSG